MGPVEMLLRMIVIIKPVKTAFSHWPGQDHSSPWANGPVEVERAKRTLGHWFTRKHPMESKVLSTHMNCIDTAVKEMKEAAKYREITLFCLHNTKVFLALLNLWSWSLTKKSEYHPCVCHCPLLDKLGNVVVSLVSVYYRNVSNNSSYLPSILFFIFHYVFTCSILTSDNNALK